MLEDGCKGAQFYALTLLYLRDSLESVLDEEPKHDWDLAGVLARWISSVSLS